MDNPERIGSYKDIEKIGEGGYGIVYKGVHEDFKRPAAIKVLQAKYRNDLKYKQAYERFKREASILQHIRHENLVEIIECNDDEECGFFIAMELLPGDLGKLIKERGRISVTNASKIAVQIAEGLAKLHDRKIIHRDLKPQNVLMDENGVAKVADLGVAYREDRSLFSVPGQRMGTEAYMAPEQRLGHEVDQRSDIYGLGIIMYQMLTGRLPNTHSTIPPIRDDNRNVPRDLDKVVSRALEDDPEDRFQNMREMIAAIRRAVPAIWDPESNSFPSKSSSPFRKVMFGTMGLVIIVIASLVISSTLGSNSPATDNPYIERPPVEAPPPKPVDPSPPRGSESPTEPPADPSPPAASGGNGSGSESPSDPSPPGSARSPFEVTPAPSQENDSDLSIDIIQDADPVEAGKSLTYTIVVHNAGPADAEDVVINYQLSEGAKLIAHRGCVQVSDLILECSRKLFPSGQTSLFEIEAGVDINASGVVSATTEVTSSNNDPDVANNSSSQDTNITALLELEEESHLLVSVYDKLLDNYGEFGTIPTLFDSFGCCGSDGKTWTFILKNNVKFHDGTALDVEAVKFNLEETVTLFPGFKRKSLLEKGLISEVNVLDDKMLEVVMPSQNRTFNKLLTGLDSLIVSPFSTDIPIGSGPYRFRDYQPNESLTLEANPDYWETRPNVNRLVFHQIEDESTRQSALERVEIYVMTGENAQIFDNLKDSGFIMCGTPSNYQAVNSLVKGFECSEDGTLRFEKVSGLDPLRIGLPSLLDGPK